MEWLGAVLQRFRFRGPLLVGGRRAGFTLLEAIVALTLSSVIVTLVSSVFLTQNNFYRTVVQRTRVQDNLRVVTDLIASEIRGVAGGGVTIAESGRLVVHLPIAMGGVCHRQNQHGRVHMPGLSEINGDEVAGYARQDANGDWVYTPNTWSTLLESSGPNDADECLTRSGADTVGAIDDFARFNIPGGTTLGEVIMVYRDVEFEIDDSELDPQTLAVYRKVTGDSRREFATGITSDTKFQYRLPMGTYQNSITGASLVDIEKIRVITSASGRGAGAYSYEWTVGIPLRNSN
ncbi:MAG: prepilin-type N-terminal cleavage/methylation domain-containing protein [Gemmatimonadetes bacterium]|nr:prepilin-type N-terminal cleavage/methylation domain-containing protein [Gemmatimonadota bacterium]